MLNKQAAAIAAGDFRAFHGSDELFHATLAELSGYPGMWPLILQAKTQIDRNRQLTLPLTHSGGRRHRRRRPWEKAEPVF